MLIVRIWALDQPGIDSGKGRPEAYVILPASDLQLLLSREKPPDLLKSLRWNDQIVRWCRIRLNRHGHFRKSMPVRRHHTHLISTELPQNTIQDGTTFLGRYRKSCMGDQLLEISGLDTPAFIKLHCWKSREFIPRKSQKFELRSTALERNPLLTCSCQLNRRWR